MPWRYGRLPRFELERGISLAARLGIDVKYLACTLILLSSFSPAQSAGQPKWQGTWAATVGTGGTMFAGTWNASPGAAPDTVAGTWSLRDQNGAELATGTWAAGKDGKVWKGTWQARRPSGQVYDGTWRSQIELPVSSNFAGMFEAAITKAVSGSWRMSNYAGAWTIRGYTQK
jgi:hypothetical protein